jgi:hypothetical protein
MKRIIRLTESDLTRIVKRVIKEQDEEWGQTDRGEERLQELIEEARDILENELGYSIEEINSMDERDIVEFLSDEGYEDLASKIEYLLDEEGFDTELGEGWDDFIQKKRHPEDYKRENYRKLPKDALKSGSKIDREGTIITKRREDPFDEWSHGDDDEEFV